MGDRSFEDLKIRADAILRALPLNVEDYDALREEARTFLQMPRPAPTLAGLSDEIEQVQAARDRVTDMLIDAQRNYLVRKEIADELKDAYMVVSVASSQDRRKADASIQLGDLRFETAEAEGFMKGLMGIARNLESRQEAASRRITCLQLAMKLGDVGRESLVRDLAQPRNTGDIFDSAPVESSGDSSSAPTEASEVDW